MFEYFDEQKYLLENYSPEAINKYADRGDERFFIAHAYHNLINQYNVDETIKQLKQSADKSLYLRIKANYLLMVYYAGELIPSDKSIINMEKSRSFAKRIPLSAKSYAAAYNILTRSIPVTPEAILEVASYKKRGQEDYKFLIDDDNSIGEKGMIKEVIKILEKVITNEEIMETIKGNINIVKNKPLALYKTIRALYDKKLIPASLVHDAFFYILRTLRYDSHLADKLALHIFYLECAQYLETGVYDISDLAVQNASARNRDIYYQMLTMNMLEDSKGNGSYINDFFIKKDSNAYKIVNFISEEVADLFENVMIGAGFVLDVMTLGLGKVLHLRHVQKADKLLDSKEIISAQEDMNSPTIVTFAWTIDSWIGQGIKLLNNGDLDYGFSFIGREVGSRLAQGVEWLTQKTINVFFNLFYAKKVKEGIRREIIEDLYSVYKEKMSKPHNYGGLKLLLAKTSKEQPESAATTIANSTYVYNMYSKPEVPSVTNVVGQQQEQSVFYPTI